MNDRYLYRAKRKNWRELPKEMWWVEGYYAYFKQNDNHCIYYETDGFTLVCDIDISTLCACTGLKDKNGKLIWENDICDRKEEYPEIVKYHYGDWTLDYSYASNKKSGFNYCNLGFYVKERKCVEVIGNIFDNPELLEGDEDAVKWKAYKSIGTPDECMVAVEKQIPKKITHPGCFDNEGVWHTWNGINGVPYDLCPNCKTNLCTDGIFGRDKKRMKYCENCGQKLDWSDEK